MALGVENFMSDDPDFRDRSPLILLDSHFGCAYIVLPDGVRFTAKPWSRKDVLELARAAVAEQ
jgi:hypothetical protein